MPHKLLQHLQAYICKYLLMSTQPNGYDIFIHFSRRNRKIYSKNEKILRAIDKSQGFHNMLNLWLPKCW